MGVEIAVLALFSLCSGVRSAAFGNLNPAAETFIMNSGISEIGYEDFELASVTDSRGEIIHPLDGKKAREKREKKEEVVLHITTNAETFRIRLDHVRSALNPNAEIIFTDGESRRRVHHSLEECFLVGNLTSHGGGTASFSYCDGLRGGLRTSEHEYLVQPIDERVLVAKRSSKWAANDHVGGPFKPLNTGPGFPPDNSTRQNAPADPTIELAVYCDHFMTARLNRIKALTVDQKLNYILVKLNGVQYEYAKKDILGYYLHIDVKKVEFWTSAPTWYQTSTLNAMVISLCAWQQYTTPDFDLNLILTGNSNSKSSASGYTKGLCKPKYRCAASADYSWGHHDSEAIAIGYTLSLDNDMQTPCSVYPTNQLGLMGNQGTGFSSCSVDAFRKFIQSSLSHCLFTINVPLSDIRPPQLKNTVLRPLLPGMYKTPDDHCMESDGPGYRYRDIADFTVNGCYGHFCVQTDPSEKDYGVLHYHNEYLFGKSCGYHKVCFVFGKCMSWSSLDFSVKVPVQQGGWSIWGSETSCSRSCGTGVTFSRRRCNNPKPENAPPCAGNEYKARLCNLQPCPGDSTNTDQLTNQRATEVCTYLIDNGFTNSSVFEKRGTFLNKSPKLGNCEAVCHRLDNGIPGNDRFALLPDGTPCKYPDPQYSRGFTNVRLRCLQGTCQVFDCEGKFPPTKSGSLCQPVIVGW